MPVSRSGTSAHSSRDAGAARSAGRPAAGLAGARAGPAPEKSRCFARARAVRVPMPETRVRSDAVRNPPLLRRSSTMRPASPTPTPGRRVSSSASARFTATRSPAARGRAGAPRASSAPCALARYAARSRPAASAGTTGGSERKRRTPAESTTRNVTNRTADWPDPCFTRLPRSRRAPASTVEPSPPCAPEGPVRRRRRHPAPAARRPTGTRNRGRHGASGASLPLPPRRP